MLSLFSFNSAKSDQEAPELVEQPFTDTHVAENESVVITDPTAFAKCISDENKSDEIKLDENKSDETESIDIDRRQYTPDTPDESYTVEPVTPTYIANFNTPKIERCATSIHFSSDDPEAYEYNNNSDQISELNTLLNRVSSLEVDMHKLKLAQDNIDLNAHYLQDKEEQLQEKQFELAEKEALLQQRNHMLPARENELQDYEITLQCREGELQDNDIVLQNREFHYQNQQNNENNNKEYENKLCQREFYASVRDADLNRKEYDLAQREYDVAQREYNLQHCEHNLRWNEYYMREREDSVSQREYNLAQREYSLKQYAEGLINKNRMLEMYENDLNEESQDIENANNALLQHISEVIEETDKLNYLVNQYDQVKNNDMKYTDEYPSDSDDDTLDDYVDDDDDDDQYEDELELEQSTEYNILNEILRKNRFLECFNKLIVWIEQHGRLPSLLSGDDKEYYFATWCSTMRQNEKKSLLLSYEKQYLETIPNWFWLREASTSPTLDRECICGACPSPLPVCDSDLDSDLDSDSDASECDCQGCHHDISDLESDSESDSEDEEYEAMIADEYNHKPVQQNVINSVKHAFETNKVNNKVQDNEYKVNEDLETYLKNLKRPKTAFKVTPVGQKFYGKY